MVKLIEVKNKRNEKCLSYEGGLAEYADVVCELYADDLSELQGMTEVEGLNLAQYTITPGSYCYDKNMNIAVLDSDGTWNVN